MTTTTINEHTKLTRPQLLNDIVIPSLALLNISPPSSRQVAEYRRAEAQLLMGTNAVESPNFDRRQLGGGPALGIFQMEGRLGEGTPRTHEDIWINYLSYRPRYANLLSPNGVNRPYPPASRLVDDDIYAACMARLQYRRSPLPLPVADDISTMDRLYLIYYNGGGKSKVGEFTEAYYRLVAPLFILPITNV